MTAHFPEAEILSQGEEVVSGAIVDTNAAWLAQELIGLGFDVTRHTAVGDRLDDLAGLLSEIAERSDCCICTGGLGPTVDDLTAAATARAFERVLRLDENALNAIRAWYDNQGHRMPETNRKQALLPDGSQRLDNHWGTAPGYTLRQGRCRFYFLPGVPAEMREMFDAGVRPQLREHFHTRPPRNIVLRTVGAGESLLQARMNHVALPANTELGFCVVGPEVHVKLRVPADLDATLLLNLMRDARRVLGDDVFAIDGLGEEGGDLAAVVGRSLSRRRATLAIVETVSGGLLSSLCAGLESLRECRVYPHTEGLAQAYFPRRQASTVALANDVARRLQEQTEADYVLVQLSSGPANLHVTLLTPIGLLDFARPLTGEPDRRRLIAAAYTLDQLRRHLSLSQ